MTKSLQFLSGGGEMGALMRAYIWESSPVGPTDKWPQSLLTTLGILLNSKFPMFLFWGPHHVCFYNDAYRPSLGNEGKHPGILGKKGADAWPEIWHIIKPLIDQVLAGGEATWSEDQLIPIFRNGKMEDVYWTFSYSPVNDESGLPAGVFVTCIETTDKVKNLEKFAESNDQLSFAIEATQLGTWDYNPLTNKFTSNNRLKEWFGLPQEMQVDLALAIDVMVEKDRSRVAEAIQRALQYESGGLYDIEYGIVNLVTKQERIVKAKGKAWFGDDKTAYRFNGTLQDITQQSIARKIIDENEQRLSDERMVLYNSFMNAPAGIAIYKGDTHIYEFANVEHEKTARRKITIGKTVQALFPELEQQGLIAMLNNVYSSGEPFVANEFPIELSNEGSDKLGLGYYNLVVQPLMDEKGNTERIMWHAVEVTQQVEARKLIEASEILMRQMASHLKLATDSANVGTWSLDLQTKKLEWNALHKKMWGYGEHRTDLEYEDWHKLILPEDKELAFKRVEDARISHNFYEVEYRINKADGDVIRSIRSVGKYYYNDKGEAETLTGISVDITQQKESELKLKASEEKYRGLFETMEQGFCIIELIFDIDNNPVNYLFIEANPMFEKQAGTTNPVGKTIRALVPNMEERWFQIYGKVALTGEANHFIDHSEEVDRWFEIYAFRLGDQGSKKVAILFTDISQRKQAEEKIKASEEQFRTFANSIQNLSWIANGDGWIYWYNQRWYDYTGTTLEEMEGWGWEKVHHPDHVERVVNFAKEAWKKDEPFDNTFPLRRYDGAYRWFQTHAYPVKDANGNIERWIGTNTDITEQKSFTEELEKQVAERTAELNIKNQTFEVAEKIAKFGSYKWNTTTGALEYSDNLFLLLDCEPNEFEPSFEKFLSFIHPDDLQQVIKNGEETMGTGRLVETPYRIISKTGRIKHLRSSGSFTGENDNHILIGTVQDISKDIEAAEALKTINLELANSNAELASFSYIASHDLQEPLRKIQTFAKRIIETEKFSDKTQDYFNRIITAGERMQNLIISLLDFSRTNTTELIFVPCDLNTLVEESENDLHISISEKEAIIEHENLPVIMGVRIQLSQLFTNLIDNAIKYSRPGVKPLIKITSEIIEGKEIEHIAANEQTKYHAIQFSDNGIGFEQEYANKIFELFQRLHGKNEYSGTGIGLGIVKKIVTNHNGFIIAKGKPNTGSTFTIYIPTA